MQPLTVEALIQAYSLLPHPEGGYFRETYRAPEAIAHAALPARFNGDRAYATAILFLLPQGSQSHLHRIAADEIWHFYLGDPLDVVILHPTGALEVVPLGQDLQAGQHLQYVVPAGCWFGALPQEGGQFSFVGCTVSPGFDFEDFELAQQAKLLSQYPDAAPWIERLTPEEVL